MILWPGSGGWSYPLSNEEIEGMPPMQLFNLNEDPSEKDNLILDHPEKANQLRSLLISYIKEGRSTPGPALENDGPEKWEQLEWMDF